MSAGSRSSNSGRDGQRSPRPTGDQFKRVPIACDHTGRYKARDRWRDHTHASGRPARGRYGYTRNGWL